MIDKYSYYVLFLGLGEDFFWHAPIHEVEKAANNKIAIDAWLNNPQTMAR